jgi:hypothetical protein
MVAGKGKMGSNRGLDESSIEQMILATCQQLVKEEFAYTVKVSGTMWDVYYHEMPDGRDATIAFCMKGEKAVIGVFSAGKLGEEEVRSQLYTN